MSNRLRAGSFGKCRTVDKLDIFGDNSGKALYRLDGNANDESGNYHGTEVGATVYGGGVYERGIRLSGTSNYIDTQITLPTGNKTFSMWVNTSFTADYQYICANNLSSDLSGNVSIRINQTSGTITVHYWMSNVMDTGTISTISVANGQWNHIVCVIRPNGTSELYINNTLNTTSAGISGTDAITPNGICIGGRRDYAGFYFNGTIDQVRIFNRAITATEVATLYAECAPTSTVDNINPFEDGSLKALYQFNGDATDKTGVYNGTATNVTYGTGKFGQCAVFNGTSSKVTTSYLPNTIVSVAGWVKTTSISTQQAFVNCNSGLSTNGGFELGFLTSQLRLIISGSAGWVVTASFGSGLTSNTWYHVAFVLNSNICRVYVDGILAYTSGTIAPISATTQALQYGYGGSNGYFNGSQDQARIFNKALTPMEVASLYNETTPLEEPMHSLVDPFKDGSGKALYRLDGNALDESGNYNGTATSVTYGAGRFGRAFTCDGTARYIQTTLNQSLMPIPFTYSVWFNTTTAAGGILSNAVGGVSDATKIDTAGVGGRLRFASVGRILEFQSTASVTTGAWVHAVVTWDGTTTTNAVKMYINGVLDNQSTASSASAGYNAVFYIGRYGTYATYFTGSVDQVRIFNRALTAGEVSTLYTEI